MLPRRSSLPPPRVRIKVKVPSQMNCGLEYVTVMASPNASLEKVSSSRVRKGLGFRFEIGGGLRLVRRLG
eukprot:1348632-Amorphochlora_amoeboformis.AAC.1